MTRPPMQYTSRTMPPMPVAAPSTGMTWLGWLWDSWARMIPYRVPWNSPKSTMPASSTGPTTTLLPVVGRLAFRCGRLLL